MSGEGVEDAVAIDEDLTILEDFRIFAFTIFRLVDGLRLGLDAFAPLTVEPIDAVVEAVEEVILAVLHIAVVPEVLRASPAFCVIAGCLRDGGYEIGYLVACGG